MFPEYISSIFKAVLEKSLSSSTTQYYYELRQGKLQLSLSWDIYIPTILVPVNKFKAIDWLIKCVPLYDRPPFSLLVLYRPFSCLPFMSHSRQLTEFSLQPAGSLSSQTVKTVSPCQSKNVCVSLEQLPFVFSVLFIANTFCPHLYHFT